MLTEAVHLNLMPLDGALSEVDWLEFALASVKTHSKNENPTTFQVKYAMDSHPAFDESAFCLRRCHVQKPCECDRGKRQKTADKQEVRSKNKAN